MDLLQYHFVSSRGPSTEKVFSTSNACLDIKMMQGIQKHLCLGADPAVTVTSQSLQTFFQEEKAYAMRSLVIIIEGMDRDTENYLGAYSVLFCKASQPELYSMAGTMSPSASSVSPVNDKRGH